ncbi:MAG: thrombospondin type 3 repeat-containing protein [Candidatus Rokubacteria bacterium]|nr:thrombospondin type 3 repeat-containing protein [Candidatus Rokubacteria bacterium]
MHAHHINPWTGQFEPFESLLDWAESVYSVTSNTLIKRDYKFQYNVGPPVPFSICTQGGQKPEGDLVETTSVDPPLGPETEAFFDQVEAAFAQIPASGVPMGEDTSKRCDFNGDGRCDAADVQLFEGSLGSCLGGASYHPQADTDGSGCVDAQDRFHLFEQDVDGDGIPDTADNCLTVANPDQNDSDGDRVGDACASGLAGDLDNDGDVDRDDLSILLADRNTAAAGANDPRDLDRDGRITALDARKLVLLCTRPNCAIE